MRRLACEHFQAKISSRRSIGVVLLLLLSLNVRAEVVAIANQHYSLVQLQQTLQQVGLIDEDLQWQGNDASLVNLGDYGLDSGTQMLQFLQDLQRQAATENGKVVLLLGEQDVAYLRAYKGGQAELDWLLQHGDFILQINDTLFAHRGLSKTVAETGVEAYNRQNKSLMQQGKLHLSPEFMAEAFTPFQYRGSAFCHPYNESYTLESGFATQNAQRLVIGHGEHDGSVQKHMDGLLLSFAAGTDAPGYLTLTDKGWQQYINQQPVAFKPRQRDFPLLPDGMTDQDVETFLTRAEVIERERLGVGVTKSERVVLRHQGRELSALFKTEDTSPRLERQRRQVDKTAFASDRYQYEVAAYRLDRLMNLNMITPAVIRDIDGQSGSLQLWLDKVFTETDREEQNIPFQSICNQSQQYRVRVAFDVLIYNDDRNLGNIAWSRKSQLLYLIDHSRAFRTERARPRQYRKSKIRISDYFAKVLNGLTEAELQPLLESYLNDKQTSAIIRRRDMLMDMREDHKHKDTD